MRPKTILAIAAVLAIALLPLFALPVVGLCISGSKLLDLLAGGGMLLLGMGLGLKDKELIKTKALPNGAATIYSDGFDLKNSARGDFLARCELHVVIPALSTTLLPDTQTITYSLEHDTDSAFGTTAALPGFEQIAKQTGAAGAGAAGVTVKIRLPLSVKRYVRVKAVKAGAADASGASLTEQLVF